MKIKVSETTRLQLNWLVAKIEGPKFVCGEQWWPDYSTDPAQGQPILEQEKITVVCAEGDYNPSKSGTPDCYDTYWVAEKGRLTADTVYGSQGDDWGRSFRMPEDDAHTGPTMLIAGLRCYVASKLGDEVEVPDELNGGDAS